ncbi:MAG: SUMF1/EgtB/PvdO family nonheme iron enzyme [Bacteroidota bacterium]
MKTLSLFLLVFFLFSGCKKDTPTEQQTPTKPVVSIVSPKNNAVIFDTTSINVQATDDKGIVRVEIYIDNQLDSSRVFVVKPFKWLWNVSDLTDSSKHIIYAKAYDADNNMSSTPIVNVTKQSFSPPTNLMITSFSDTSVNLQWQDNSSTETGFEIEQSAGDTNNFALVQTVGTNITTTTIAGAYDTITYYFRVRAKTLHNFTRYAVNNFTLGFPAPTNLTATFQADTAVSLQWQDNSNFETGFLIEQGTDGINYQLVDSADSNITIKTLQGIFLTTHTYYFRVKAKSLHNFSNYAKNTKALNFPTPTNLTATFLSDVSVKLDWQDNSNYETGFLIEQGTDGINYQLVDSVNANVATRNLQGIYLTTNTYYFRVKAKSLHNFSNYVTGTRTLSFPAPSNLTAIFLSETMVKLDWQDHNNFETGFLIEQGTDGINYQLVDSVNSNITTKNVQGIYLTTSTYYFRIRAKSLYNFSNYATRSQTLSFPAPSNLTANFLSDTVVSLQWHDNSSYETGFLIEQGTDGVNYQLVDSVNTNITTKNVIGMFLTTSTYYFRIRAKSLYNFSNYATRNQAFIFPPPTNLIANFFSDTTIVLQWQDNSNFENEFEIEQSTDSTNFILVKTVGTNTTSTTIFSAFDTITYYFRVRAKSNINTSGYSNIENITHFSNSFLQMIFLQGGTYQMGSNLYSNEQPIHSVTLSNFYISKYEVTQSQWKRVIVWKQQNGGTTLSATPSYFTGDSLRPVEQVSWNDVTLWISYLNEMLGTNTYHLPTEAEWEYAARGGIHAGDNYTYSGGNDVNSVAWYSSNSGNATHKAGTKVVNQLGFNDMSGNVREWCNDWYSATYYSVSPQNNPPGPSNGSTRVLRGGSWSDNVSYCRVANRTNYYPTDNYYNIGFRIARSN